MSRSPGGRRGIQVQKRLHAPARVFIGRDASAEFFKGPGTTLSPGLAHIAAQVAFAILSTRGGRAGMAGAAGLTAVGVGATAGALGEKTTFAVLSPRTFDPAKVAIVSAGIALSSLMTILGARFSQRLPPRASSRLAPRILITMGWSLVEDRGGDDVRARPRSRKIRHLADAQHA